ncbi:SdrD B-like domain-containing protein [Lewinella sp. W8]|uniref:SdrD B-like domain-containing protein n=1 Tax=Lewinella sp. W8 TaxID=2528208 RepID=UPI001C12C3A5
MTIDQPEPLVATGVTTDVICNDDAGTSDDGTITLTVVGGTAGYTYAWSNGATTQNLSGLAAGTYTVVVTDANGCTTTESFTIDQPEQLVVTGTTVDVECNGDATGSIDITVSGGTTEYTIDWTDIAGNDNAEDRSGLVAGTYTVVVTDANGCTTTASFTIEEASDLLASVEDFALDCFGDNDGSLTAVASGGTAPYTYLWSTGATSITIDNLVAGSYSVTITDANGCTEVATGTVTQPDAPLSVTEVVVDVDCAGAATGSIDLTVAGGTPAYSFNWSNGATTEDLTGIAAGTYSVTITDANGCELMRTYEVEDGAPLVASVEDDTICLDSPERGTLTVVVLEGSGNYQYQWDAATGNQTTATATDLMVGVYTVLVTDTETGCTTVVTGEVIGDNSECAGLGDYVWEDANENGIQDEGEKPIQGVVVNLKDENGVVIATTTTDQFGFYSFEGLAAGTYSVQFELPDMFEFTALNAGAEDVDSDADPAMNGMTEPVTLTNGEFYPDLDAGIVAIPICELTAVITEAPECDDNGTPTDPTDDFYTVTVLVEGVSPSGQWRDNLGNFGDLGVPFTYQLPVNDDVNPESVTLNYSGATTAQCSAEVSFLPVGSCSDQCYILAAGTSSPFCDDLGTPTDPSDDVFFVPITVTSLNATSTGWTAFDANDNVVATGVYDGNEAFAGPFTLEDVEEGEIVITVRDNARPRICFSIVRAEAPQEFPCSDECQITMEFVDSWCYDNGTDFDPSDDVWFATVRISGVNAADWSAPEFGYVGGFPFGEYVFGPFTNPVSGTQTIAVSGVGEDSDCMAEVLVTAPGETCSDNCAITGEVLAVECDDAGTPSDPTDDVFFITVTADRVGSNNSDDGWIVREGTSRTSPIIGEGPIFGNTYTFGPLPIFDENGNRRETTNLRIEDADAYFCRVDTMITIPEPCSNAECEIMLTITETICDDNGTPFDESDDTYDFVLLATGAAGDYNLVFNAPAGVPDAIGTFGVAERFGPIPVGVNVSGMITALNNDNCVGALFVQAVTGCDRCKVGVDVFDIVCNDQGTSDPSDDTFSAMATIFADSDENGPAWMVEDPIRGLIIGTYGETISLGDYPISGGDITLRFIDVASGGSCFEEVTIEAPETCSPCDIDATLVSVTECIDNDTPTDPTDDFFVATILVTGNNTAGTWRIDGTEITGNYGENTEVTFPANGELLELVILDGENNECLAELDIQAPEDCGEEVPCELVAEVTGGPECTEDGNGYIIDVLVTNSGSGSDAGWTADNGLSGAYGETVSITVEELCGPTTIIFRDADDELCADTVTVTPSLIEVEGPADVDRIGDRDLICEDGDAIFNNEESLELTGTVTITGCGETTVTFDDVYLNEGIDCEDVVIERTFTVAVCTGEEITATQRITIRKPLVTDISFPTDTIDFDCEDASFPQDDNGNPATSVTGLPTIMTAFDNITIEDVFCGTITVSYEDEMEETCSGTQTIIRTWTATDICTGDTRSAEQIIRTGDFTPPVVSCPISNHYCPVLEEDIMLFPMDPFDCVANLEVPLPDVTDVCSDSWTILTEILNAQGEVVATINDGDDRNLTLEAGDYTIRYTVTDDCGNTAVTDCIIRVADTQEPAAICISHINVSVGGYGIARVYSSMIDLGSYDNCGLDSVLIRRQILVDPVTGDTLDVPTWSDWELFTEVNCLDAGSVVTLQLRVVDFGGNENICTTEATVVDNTLPYCTGLDDLFLSCTDLDPELDLADTLSLQAFFGKPEVVDNCAASAIELMPIVDIDECSGAGTVIRRFLAVDLVGNVSAQEFIQTISITPDMGFTLVIPKDTLTECIEVAQGFEIIGESCADISLSFTDTIVDPNESEEGACLVVERTYLVINNCMFDPATDVPVVISRDEDCDGLEGEEVFYAIVNPDGTFIDVDQDIDNALPIAGTRGDECDGETNPTGYLRQVATTGAWTYTQRIAIFDDTRPELVFETPDTFCASEDGNCEAMIEIPITVAGECTAAGSNWLVLIDLGRDGAPEMRLPSELAVHGEFPNYRIVADLPIGEHTLMLRYVDGCNNATAATVPVTVIDCSIPDPTCYSGLIANLETLAEPVTLANGDLVETGVYVDAGRLASCDIEDCSGPLRFSVNRPGETPNVDSTSILLTCDDRYSVDLEVYMWDSAFNPDAVQPDGTVGGPNWTVCTVEVFVQDPDELCDDCNADGTLALGGQVITAGGVALPGVEVDLSGELEDFKVTDDNGIYEFGGVPAGNYVVEPTKVDDVANGLSTLDELILQRHLVGEELITDPYRFLAADMNGSGTLTVLDRLIMRNIVLGNTDVLAAEDCWRFVPKAYLEEMANELTGMSQIPSSIKVDNFEACDLGHDFVGVKLGDLNASVFIENSRGEILNGTRGRSSGGTHPVEIPEASYGAGERFSVPVRAKDLQRIAGLQFTLRVAEAQAFVTEVVPGMLTNENLGLENLDRGLISASWILPTEGLDGDAVLFTLKGRTNTVARASDLFALVDAPTYAEAYRNGDLEALDLYLNFPAATINPVNPQVVGDLSGEAFEEMTLRQNFPNPFRTETTIAFTLPSSGEARLRILDMTGRELQVIEREFTAGEHQVKLDGNRFSPGVMIYTLEFRGERLVRSMIRVE